MFNSDSPINNITEDLLERSNFARNVANAIQSYGNPECLTIGIYGGWGEGKSSLANMILSEIPKTSDDTKYVIINFNPWLYSNTEDLIAQLFKTISNIFKFSNVNATKENTTNVIEKVGKAVKAVSHSSLPIVNDVASIISKLFRDYANFLKGKEKRKTLEEIKYKIDNKLSKNKVRLIIVIDDFDRLSQEEIRLMFQVVKILGDFQNTVYLLLMDKDVVVNSLKGVQGGDGDDYLRKIIQIPITIPKISNSQLNFVLHKEFEKVISVDKYTLIKDLYNEIINVCVIPFISTIRDVKRIINIFEFKNSFLKDEVNQADLLALCALELYVPEAYDIIRSNKENLTKFHSDKISALEQKIQNLNINHDRNAVSNAIVELFSKSAKSSLTDKFRRLSDRNYFDTFFSLSLPSSIIPFEVINNIIKNYSKQK